MNQQPMGAPKPAVSKWLWIVLIVVVLGAAGYFGWYYLMGPGKKVETSTSTPTATTTTPSTNTTTPTTTTPTTTDKTAGWKTYTNETYGFSFKYPSSMTLSEKTWSKDGDEVIALTNTDSKTKTPDMTVRYSKLTAKTDEVTSNTIGVWLKDKFTSEITAKNVTTETINGVKFNDAEMQADPSYFAMLVSNDNGIYAIDFSVQSKATLTETLKTLLTTFKFTK
ncbi:hypothetical protein A2V71_01925 [Candidatus Berkelbacteria bacterium RBG_13_40_8]|uniref:Uncharacterized protein n=1 Tax=Candidatus Berkelbacteria bacterium RBG_13_40_8 TaxID=1797467 RepID=A0A1F5DPU5_9BACT|nr:MAG: hypothetical protein A2V71_01925 [Candidatus Berkelbacteria bacterium RBG_13_40_8]